MLLLLLLPLLPVFIVQLIISSAFADVETVAFELAAAWLTHADGARVFGRLVRDTSHWTLGVACFAKRRRPPRALRAALAPVLALEADLAAVGR